MAGGLSAQESDDRLSPSRFKPQSQVLFIDPASLPLPAVKGEVSDSSKPPADVKSDMKTPEAPIPWFETGKASWYGGKFQGRLTANGEIFDTHKLSAAHKTLPFNTVVRVTNLDNGKSVVIRINDRGPFVEGRIIDLSQAAAKELDMVNTGVANVGLEIVTMGDGKTYHKTTAKNYTIQIASFSDLSNADDLIQKLTANGMSAGTEKAGVYTRVVVSAIHEADLETVKTKLTEMGINGFIVRCE